jgi:hypothetical protein
MKYVVKTSSDVMTYIPSFIKTDSGIEKLIMGIHRHIDSREIA